MVLKLKTLSVALVFCCSGLASEDLAQPNRWHGLALNMATPQDVASVLGTPESDKPDRLFIWRITKWFTPGLNKKVLRKQSFKSVEGFDRVDLYYKDDKLVVIQLDFSKQPDPTALRNTYGLDFAPYISGFDEAIRPQDFERHQGKVYPKTFPPSYGLVAVSADTIISAEISNSGLGAVMKQSMGVRDVAGGGFPGKVKSVQLISRTLENRTGLDLLK